MKNIMDLAQRQMGSAHLEVKPNKKLIKSIVGKILHK